MLKHVVITLYRCEILTKSNDYSGTSELETPLHWYHAVLVLFLLKPVGIPHFGFAGILKGR